MTVALASRPRPASFRTAQKMKVESFSARADMGSAAAIDVIAALVERLARQDHVRMIFAAAPSQSEFLAALCAAEGVDWSRVTVFHMDEYIGLPDDSPARFANWLDQHIFEALPFASVHRIEPGDDAMAEAQRYAHLLNEAPIDFVCLGIGVNGHIAFNDPPVADFNDPLDVKIVLLDEICRQQQVDDNCFPNLDAVPQQALTLTIPRLMRANRLFCIVPGTVKRNAVNLALHSPLTPACPASILRTHENCTLYLDKDADPDV